MAISMAVFGGDAFTQAEMIQGINKKPYVPSMLDTVIGFTPRPVSTDTVYLSVRTGQSNLIQVTLRGAPIEMGKPDEKNVRPFAIPRVAKGDQLFAHQLANIVPFEDESETDAAAFEIARMQDQLISDVEATMEHMRLGALNGIVLAADGSTIVNYFTEFGVSVPSDIDLTLDNAALTIGALRTAIGTNIVLPIARASGAGNDPRFKVRALCGDAFWFALTGHPAIEKTYEGYAAAASRRDETLWEMFEFAGVEWYHYRGTDDNSTIAIATNKAKVFPTGVPGMWQHVMGPANEFLNLLGQRGRRYVPFLIRDMSGRDQWAQPEIYSYPLFVNARPDLVLTVTI